MISVSTPRSASLPPLSPAHTLPRIAVGPEWLVCLLISALWFGCTAGLRPLAIPDEGRYVGVAWEMLRSGNWAVPTLDGLPFFHKPPLFYWITAASMHLFGPGVAAARAAAWLASVSITTGLFAFVARWADRRQAWATVIVLGTMPLFYGGSQYANLDMLVAACISAAILLTVHSALARARGWPHRRTLAMAFVAAALGVLAKGLIGVVLPVLVLLGWGLATRRLGRVTALLMWAPGWLLFAGVAAPWFILMQQRFPDFGHYFFVVQHLQRFASAGFNNPQPWWFYPVALLALTLPWSPWLAGLRRRGRGSPPDPAGLHSLMLVWLGVVTVFFSLPSSKLVGYILPAIAPLAFLIAKAAGVALRGGAPAQAGLGQPMPRPRRLFLATAVAAATVCVGTTAAMHFYQPKSLQSLAESLRASRAPGEPVVFLGIYPYDLTFYAHLDAPVTVVDPWLDSEVAKDSWRRELVDASRFAPAGATRRLIGPAEVGPLLCQVRSSWVVGAWPPAAESAWLAALPPAHQSGATALWHVVTSRPATRSALACSGTASAAR
jgi:4-amino-4-deoxy-L-arabinose transferase-like glycosyltransferase